MTEREAWIKLSLAKGVGEETLKVLVRKFDSPRDVIQADRKRLKAVTSSEIATNIRECVNVDVKKHISLMDSLGVKLIPFTSDDYPERLKCLPYAPPLLYVRGDLKDDNPSIAIIGSRRASHYGKMVAEKFARELARVGLTIVSGLARGIDTQAHKGALEENGRTIAVLGCGIDRVYPSENVYLIDKIITNGACISEFPIGTHPFAGNFPLRNRIISGLSDAILVVEATQRSGTFTTVGWALEQGKEIFAIPGNITEETSKGTNKLIMDGARPVTSVQDIIDALKLDRIITKRVLPLLTEDEKAVYEKLGNTPTQIDQLSVSLSIPVSKLSGILLSLELKSVVKQLPGRYFMKEQ
ncbi:MAG: DNA-processing protein DprA [Bacteroidales bacterium]|nr:DNA-processing protein DprA [Bacteroidales bacterium]